MKRIVSIQDLSSLGRCSLTVALPVISAMGIECAAIPTAVLSAHTGFGGFSCLPLTQQLAATTAHWQAMQLPLDAICTGYLATEEQPALVCRFFDACAQPETLIFVDPAMADNGRLYPTFSADFPAKMAQVCARADVIVPNLTEACLLTGTEYRTDYDAAYLHRLLRALLSLGAKNAVITGVRPDAGQIGVVAMEADGHCFSCTARHQSAVYPGTGDLFAATCAGAMVSGKSLRQALAIAVDYVAQCIRLTMEDPAAPWYGVEFERPLPDLLRRMAAPDGGSACNFTDPW